jgi:hypothetical protein
MEELHTDSINGGHEGQLWARSRARERAYSNTGPAITGIVIGAITAIALVTIATLLLLRYRKTFALSNKPEIAAFPVVSELRSEEHANRHEAQGKELKAERFEMNNVLVKSRQVRHEMPT